MPSLIVNAQNDIFGTSADDIPAADVAPNLVIDITQPQFDALPDNVTDYPHRWNPTTMAAEAIFDLATYRVQAIELFERQAVELREARFQSNALATMYDYDTRQADLFFIVSAAVSNQATMITTYTGEVPTDRQHTAMQVQAVLSSFFDSRAAIATRFRTAVAAVNAATTQMAIDAVTL